MKARTLLSRLIWWKCNANSKLTCVHLLSQAGMRFVNCSLQRLLENPGFSSVATKRSFLTGFLFLSDGVSKSRGQRNNVGYEFSRVGLPSWKWLEHICVSWPHSKFDKPSTWEIQRALFISSLGNLWKINSSPWLVWVFSSHILLLGRLSLSQPALQQWSCPPMSTYTADYIHPPSL